MNSSNTLINNIDDSIYRQMLTAIELGHWEGGQDLSASQKDICIQAIIAYENKHLSEAEKTGYIHKEKHEPCDSNEDQPVNIDLLNPKV